MNGWPRNDPKYAFHFAVADVAEATFARVKLVKKMLPTRNRAEKDALAAAIKAEHEVWWDVVKNNMSAIKARGAPLG